MGVSETWIIYTLALSFALASIYGTAIKIEGRA
jgi:hypothetical protein